MKLQSKTVLITGATSGIGKSCAVKFAEESCRIIITGRRKDRLNELANELKKTYNIEVLTLNFDVRNQAEVQTAIDSLSEEWKVIDILINNAGLAMGLSTIQDGDLQDWETMIDTNVKGLLYVSKAVMPVMIQRNQGHIINIGSIAGKDTYAKGNVYCATKFAVDSLTKAMRIDLLPHKINVTGIHPGAVETEFSIVRFHGDVPKADAVYDGFDPLTPDDIADVIVFAASRPKHVNLSDIVITPTAQANPYHIIKENI